MAFKMRSGNSPLFKNVGSSSTSPAKKVSPLKQVDSDILSQNPNIPSYQIGGTPGWTPKPGDVTNPWGTDMTQEAWFKQKGVESWADLGYYNQPVKTADTEEKRKQIREAQKKKYGKDAKVFIMPGSTEGTKDNPAFKAPTVYTMMKKGEGEPTFAPWVQKDVNRALANNEIRTKDGKIIDLSMKSKTEKDKLIAKHFGKKGYWKQEIVKPDKFHAIGVDFSAKFPGQE